MFPRSDVAKHPLGTRGASVRDLIGEEDVAGSRPLILIELGVYGHTISHHCSDPGITSTFVLLHCV